jgi:AP-1 complex subunit gamma-1
VKAGSASPIR